MMISTSPPQEVLEARIQMLLAFDRRRWLAQVKPAPLVLCAEDDQLTPMHCALELAEQIPGARLARLAWGGHAVSQTDADSFLGAVLPMLAVG